MLPSSGQNKQEICYNLNYIETTADKIIVTRDQPVF